MDVTVANLESRSLGEGCRWRRAHNMLGRYKQVRLKFSTMVKHRMPMFFLLRQSAKLWGQPRSFTLIRNPFIVLPPTVMRTVLPTGA